MTHTPDVPHPRPVCAQSTTTPQTPEEVQTGRQKPTVIKTGGLTIIKDVVIPRKKDGQLPGRFRSESHALLRRKDVTSNQKNILTVLKDMLGKNDRTWPSVATLARETGLAESTVSKAVQRLEERRWLIIDEGGGRNRSNRYYITQLAYPCKLDPDVLCDRKSCPGECPWSTSNVQAILTQADAPKLPEDRSETENENSPASGEFNQESPRSSGSIDPETPRDPGTNQETNNTQSKKEEGKEPSAASGGGDAPSSSPDEMTPTDGNSDRQDLKKWFCQRYEAAFGKAYRWQAKDGAILKKIFDDGYDLDQVKASVEAMFRDPWAVDGPKVSMQVLSSKFNQYLPATGPQGLSANAGGSWDKMAIDVHTLPVEGEEPAVWPWPLRHNVRRDDDISPNQKSWQMSQFSGEIICQAERWLMTPDSWPLTMFGPPGNGKTTVASTILESYRDHVFPNDDNRGHSAFVSFEEFERKAVLKNINPDISWVEAPEINQEFLSDLAGKDILVLDDVCNRPMSKTHVQALQHLLMLRESSVSFGRKTILTTNRTIAELGQILGAAVADRIAGGIILRFVDESLRGRTKTEPLGLPAPEGDELAEAATASLRAMNQYIQCGPRAFQRPRSFERAATAYNETSSGNDTVESIAGAYWNLICQKRDKAGQPLSMPVWEVLFQAVQVLADHVGGLRNADRYLMLLTSITYWNEAISAVRQHCQTSGEAPPEDELIFLSPPVWKVMQPVAREMTTAA